jgi:hypothetical protein
MAAGPGLGPQRAGLVRGHQPRRGLRALTGRARGRALGRALVPGPGRAPRARGGRVLHARTANAASRSAATPSRLRQPARAVHRAAAGGRDRARERGDQDVYLRDGARRRDLDRLGWQRRRVQPVRRAAVRLLTRGDARKGDGRARHPRVAPRRSPQRSPATRRGLRAAPIGTAPRADRPPRGRRRVPDRALDRRRRDRGGPPLDVHGLRPRHHRAQADRTRAHVAPRSRARLASRRGDGPAADRVHRRGRHRSRHRTGLQARARGACADRGTAPGRLVRDRRAGGGRLDRAPGGRARRPRAARADR